jgi:hypothetical protein
MPGLIKQVKIIGTPQIVHHDTRSGPTIGHEFTVRIEAEDIRNCRLEWWERTDQPYGLDGMRPGVWCDVYELHPLSDVFRPWNEQVRMLPMGHAIVHLVDPPGIMVNEQRYRQRELCFEIRVLERNIFGTNNQRRIRARQVLRCDPISHEFHIIENDVLTPADENPPTWG